MSGVSGYQFHGDGYTFKLRTEDARKLMQQADGMQGYDPSTGWETFPQREVPVQWGRGFSDQFEFTGGLKTGGDQKLSAHEAGLAKTQLLWDRDFEATVTQTSGPAVDQMKKDDAYAQANSINPQPIDPARADNGFTFLNAIFGPKDAAGSRPINKGLDVDRDDQFTEADLNALAPLDGDAGTVTTQDFETALGQAIDEEKAAELKARFGKG